MPPVDRYPLAYHGPCFSVLDQRSVISGPRPCPVWTSGQRTFSYTTPQKRVRYSEFCRDTKALCRGRRVCGLESSHALATQRCVFWGDTELPENTVCNIAFFIHCIDRHQQWQCFVNYFISLIPVSEYWTFATECHCKGWNCGTTDSQFKPALVCP